MTAKFKVVVEKHPDGYIAYPLGVDGVIVGQGDTFDEAVSDVTSALRFHVETFGANALVVESPVLEAVVIEAALAG